MLDLWINDYFAVTLNNLIKKKIKRDRGVHPPWGNDAFSLCFRFPPYFRKILWLCGKFPKCYLFPKKFPIFIHQNFLWPFFSHWPQISNFPPIFAVSVHFPPVSRKLFFPPYFYKFPPPVLGKFTCFLHTLRVFFPLLWPWCIYASPNARTGRLWQPWSCGSDSIERQQNMDTQHLCCREISKIGPIGHLPIALRRNCIDSKSSWDYSEALQTNQGC